MDHGAEIPAWVALLERRDGLIGQLRHDVPAGWPEAVGHFVAGLKAEEASLPPGLAMLLLVDLARELDRLASGGTNNGHPERLLAAVEAGIDAPPSTEVLCDQFEDAIRDWCRRIEPGSLIPDVQAQRVANYIDQHFAEPITLTSLSRLSGCCARQLSRAFRASMQKSVRQYLQDAGSIVRWHCFAKATKWNRSLRPWDGVGARTFSVISKAGSARRPHNTVTNGWSPTALAAITPPSGLAFCPSAAQCGKRGSLASIVSRTVRRHQLLPHQIRA